MRHRRHCQSDRSPRTWDTFRGRHSTPQNEYHVVSGSGTVLTFPSSAADGSQLTVMRNDATNTPNVIRGGSDTINGETGNVSLDTDSGTTVFIYDLTNTNWIISNRFTA